MSVLWCLSLSNRTKPTSLLSGKCVCCISYQLRTLHIMQSRIENGSVDPLGTKISMPSENRLFYVAIILMSDETVLRSFAHV